MLEVSPNGSNFIINPTAMMTSGVIYYLSSSNSIATGLLNDSGILLMVSDSDYDLILFCLDKSINYSIGKLFFW